MYIYITENAIYLFIYFKSFVQSLKFYSVRVSNIRSMIVNVCKWVHKRNDFKQKIKIQLMKINESYYLEHNKRWGISLDQ